MIEILRSLIIGGVQGITEFLPISSSAHLVLVPYIFNWDYKGLNFDIALHFGTLIAIIAFFWKDWMLLATSALKGSHSKNQNDPYPTNLLWQIIIASIPAAILGFLISDYVESTLHSPLLLSANLIIFGVILFLVDKYASNRRAINSLKYKQTFTVGLAQALALIPGVSRSGITMIASRSLGLKREDAARFSFMLGTPAMLGAFVFDLKKLSPNDINSAFVFGVISSTIFGFLAIKYLLQYLKRGNFSIFMWYRIALAIAVVAVYFAR